MLMRVKGLRGRSGWVSEMGEGGGGGRREQRRAAQQRSARSGAESGGRAETHSVAAQSLSALYCSLHLLLLSALSMHSSKAERCSLQRVKRWKAIACRSFVLRSAIATLYVRCRLPLATGVAVSGDLLQCVAYKRWSRERTMEL